MSDKIAGLYTQVQQLRRRLKELDTAKADPAEVSAVADALEKLEARLEKQQEQKKQRRLQKEKMVQEEQKKQEEAQRKQEEEVQKELDFLKGKTILKEEPKVETPEQPVASTSTPMEVINPTPVATPAPVQSTPAPVQAEPAPVQELPLAASTEKETNLNVFAVDTIVEPVRGTPGSWGIVMRHDADNADVYVLWQGGKLKDDHVAGAYNPKDLRMKASQKEAMKVEVEELPSWRVAVTPENTNDPKYILRALSNVKDLQTTIDTKTYAPAITVFVAAYSKEDALGKVKTALGDDFKEAKLEASENKKEEKVEPEVFKKEKTEREKREEEFKKKKKEMGLNARKLSKNDKRANLKCIEDGQETVGTVYVFARSVMAKDGIIIPAGTTAELTQVMGDHFYLKTDKGNFVINRFDTPKLITAQLKKKANENGPSDEDVNQKAWEMYKKHWNALSSQEQDAIYKSLGVNPEASTMKKKHNPLGQGEWYEGTTDDGYLYQAKVFQGGSQFGINEGPVSKLWIIDPETKQAIVSYDRGWDTGEELVDVWQPLIDELAAKTQKAATPELKQPEPKFPNQPDPMENSGTGYGGDRPGVWVEPKASLKVAQKNWFAQKNDKGYLISDETGNQICLIQSTADLSKENLEDIVYNELLKRDLLAFTLKKPFALLKAGHKVDVLELDQKKQQFKFVSKEGEASGWAPFDVLNIEVKAIQKKSKIVHKEDGWHVLSESGKNLGGPYGSRSEAEKRLKQVEMFKHMQATRLSKNSDVVVIKKSILDNLVTNCPECFEKFKKVAKESKLKIKYASESSDNVLEQLQQIRERIQNIKTRTQTPQPPTTQAALLTADERNEKVKKMKEKMEQEQDPEKKKKMKQWLDMWYSDIKASHPIEEPAVVELIKGIEIDLDTLENMYRDNPDAIQHIEQIEDRVNELEHKIGIDVPEMPHEIEEGHEDLEKETAWKKPKPTTPAPTGFVWVYDEKMGDWVMMTSDTMY